LAADYNGDGILNILDVVSIVDLILNPQTSIQINSGTSYGECWGYCVFELELDNSNALFTASGWGWYEFPDLLFDHTKKKFHIIHIFLSNMYTY